MKPPQPPPPPPPPPPPRVIVNVPEPQPTISSSIDQLEDLTDILTDLILPGGEDGSGENYDKSGDKRPSKLLSRRRGMKESVPPMKSFIKSNSSYNTSGASMDIEKDIVEESSDSEESESVSIEESSGATETDSADGKEKCTDPSTASCTHGTLWTSTEVDTDLELIEHLHRWKSIPHSPSAVSKPSTSHHDDSTSTAPTNENKSNEESDDRSSYCSLCAQQYTQPLSDPMPTQSASTDGDEHLAMCRVPKYLHCLHVFCASCIADRLSSAPLSPLCVSCPTCHNETVLDASSAPPTNQHEARRVVNTLLATSVPSLSSLATLCQNCEAAPAAWRCEACPSACALLCNNCQEGHSQMKAFRRHEVSPMSLSHESIPPDKSHIIIDNKKVEPTRTNANGDFDTYASNVLSCSLHPAHTLHSFCQTCEQLVCSSCLCFLHSGHPYVSASEHMKTIRKDMLEKSIEVEGLMASLQTQLKQYQSDLHDIPSQQTFLNTTFDEQHNILANTASASAKEMHKQIEGEYARKCTLLHAQSEEVSIALKRRERLKSIITSIVNDPSNLQLLTVAPFVSQSVERVICEDLSALSAPESANMKLHPGSKETVDSWINSSGLVQGGATSADPLESHITSKHCGHMNGYALMEIGVVLKSSAGEALQGGGHPITVELLDLKGHVLVTADNMHRVSNAVGADPKILSEGEGGFVLVDKLNGSYDFLFYTRSNLFVSCHIKVLGEHITGSPTPYFPCHDHNNASVVQLFGPTSGHVIYSSTTYAAEGTASSDQKLYGADNLRTWDSDAGWMTSTSGEDVETVVVALGGKTDGSSGVVLLQRVCLMNWSAGTYQVSARRCVVNGHGCRSGSGGGIGHDCGVSEPCVEEEWEWVNLEATKEATAVPSSQNWSLVLSEEERGHLGPVDAVRLQLSGGNHTAFYSLHVFGVLISGEVCDRSPNSVMTE